MTLVPADLAIDIPGHPLRVRLQLDPQEMSQQLMLNDFAKGELYEEETSQLLISLLRAGDGFVDVGAHVGYFSLLAAGLVGPRGRVFSFEPEQANFQHLLQHLADNAFEQVRPYNWAVSRSPGMAAFHINADNDGGHALWQVGEHPFNERSREAPLQRPVFVTSLDEVLESAPSPIRAIKIDTEGNEVAVLQGARRVLREHTPVVICEVNRFGLGQVGSSEDELRGLMSKLGYIAYLTRGTELVPLALDDVVMFENSLLVFNLVFMQPGRSAAWFNRPRPE